MANRLAVSLMFLLYRALGALALPLLLVYLLRRIARNRAYAQHLGERFGFLPFRRTQRGGLWLHAVSVGEVLSSMETIRQLKSTLPGTPIYVSVSTLAGRDIAVQRLAGLADHIFYSPIDLCWAVRRTLRHLDPLAVIVFETEIWPNLWRETKRRGAGLIVLNGRISDRAWPLYQRFRWAFRPVLACADRILVQSEIDADRYRELLGEAGPEVESVGNLKYDATPPEANAALSDWVRRLNPSAVWIAASTMPPLVEGDIDEDEAVLAAYQQLTPDSGNGLLLILAPRRPERFEPAATKLLAAGIPFVRRSALGPLTLPGVLLLDTMGELSGAFALADVVFMGGTLARRGGHNVLEPAYFGCPVIVGPHNQNFAAMVDQFLNEGALRQITTAEQLAPTVAELLTEPGEYGARAQAAAARERGATARAMKAVLDVVDQSLTHEPGYWWLTPLEWLWQSLVTLDRALRGRGHRLPAPTVSLGNLTYGGAGKTPLTLWLAERLPRAAVLTRGYGRQSREILALPPRAQADLSATGDEAQIFLRSGRVAVGIGSNRRAAARALGKIFAAEAFLLDDGFQHWPLARDFDIVLIDTQDPFGGGRLLPVGRLREPVSALSRAGFVVLTRTQPARRYTRLLARIRQENTRAPIVRASIRPVTWMRGDEPVALAPGHYAAFCGLANPGSFRASIAALGWQPVSFTTFPDHHRYQAHDLEPLTTLATDGLLTTEKDWVKVAQLGLAAPVYWLRVELEVDGGAELLRLIRAARKGESPT
ncbi:MAG: tetraacyldisaccharide 4'-kinase [Bryobacteraceae bacterium]|nr:tetraacyldisaccharide 4'-kinase [Bryobacteraceae bacterium]